MAQEDVFKKIVSHCKEYGFVFPSSEIYDGLGAVYDYGQNGVELKNNIKQRQRHLYAPDDMEGFWTCGCFQRSPDRQPRLEEALSC